MLNDSKLICFAATRTPELAKAFYRDTLGLRLTEDSPFALAFDANGIMLRIQKFPDHVPPKTTVLGWHVQNIAAKIADLTQRGVQFERYPGLTQDPLGVWKSPSGAQIAWFKDPDGNTLSMTQWEP
jgi:catechol 2,3-dioxygenase-like lactoylglutathione lyase family enzyme